MWYNLKCQSNRYKHEKNYWQLYNNYNYDNQKREGQGWCDNRQERNQGWQNNQRYQQDRNVQSNQLGYNQNGYIKIMEIDKEGI